MGNLKSNYRKTENDESYLYRLFEEDEVPPVKKEVTPAPKTSEQLSDDDIAILGDQLDVSPQESSIEPEGVSSSLSPVK